jgi:heme A synthase
MFGAQVLKARHASPALTERPLPLAVLHNFGAALLLAALVSVLWPKEKPGP